MCFLEKKSKNYTSGNSQKPGGRGKQAAAAYWLLRHNVTLKALEQKAAPVCRRK
jgi:hypothetical protein